ncbi:MAG: MBL fold metallo-hydrolase [Arenibacterium sp.]
MKIRLLTENLASGMCWHAEWGFSAWIEYGPHRILFDTGYSDVWCHNAALAGIDLNAADVIALSHFHSDHTRGLLSHPFTTHKPIVMHPALLASLQDPWMSDDNPERHSYDAVLKTLERDFKIITSETPYEMAPGAYFLGEIPRRNGFEKGVFFDDPMPDDTALAFQTPKGAVVVSGCSHAGICNICDYAKDVTGQKLYAVIGGFHLIHKEDPPIEETFAYFETEKPDILLPVHCVEFDIQAKMQMKFGYKRPGAGSLIEL